MANGDEPGALPGWEATPRTVPKHDGPRQPMHPAWAEFVRFCAKLGHGDIERLRIQNGLPVLAEVTTKEIKFD